MSKLFKRALAVLLVLLCVLTGLPVIEVSAATEYKPDYVLSDIQAVKTSTVATDEYYHVMLKVDDKWAYCIQPGHHYGDDIEIVKGDSDTWKALKDTQKTAIYLAMLYGAEGNFDAMEDEISNLTYEQAYVATQIVVWEFVLGERTSVAPYKLVSGKAGYISTYCDGGANPKVRAAYEFIISAMSDFYKMPSFTAATQGKADTHYLQAIKHLGDWEFVGNDIVLTDDNKVLANYNLSISSINVGNGVLKSTQNGNSLTISGVSVNENGTAKLGTIKAQRKVSSLPKGGKGRLVSYGSDSYGVDNQDVVTMIFEEDSTAFNPSADPPYVYLNVGLTLSKAERDFYIQKSCKAVDASGYTTNLNDAESLSGWYFKVKLPTSVGGFYVYLGPTDSTGKTQTISEAIQSSGHANTFEVHNVPVGDYVITELGKQDSTGKSYFPDGWSSTYENNKHTFTLTENSGMNEVVKFTNNYSIPVQIKKTFEDSNGGSAPYYFLLSNSSDTVRYLLKTTNNGYLNVVKSLTGDSYRNDGNNMYLEMGSYTLSEWGQLKSGIVEGNSSSSNYTVPDRYTAVTELPITISASELKDSKLAGYETIYAEAVNIVSYPIAVIKSDKDDSTKRLSGAVFGIYSDPDCKNEITRVTTNSYGEGVTDRLRSGGYYYVREITPPTGYKYDGTIRQVYVHYSQPKITLSDGSEAIPVYADNDITPGFAAIKKVDDENSPVANVYFAFYRKSDNQCLEIGLKTNSNGIAITNSPYDPGLYYFKETSTPKGYSIDKTKEYEVEIKKSTNASEIIVFETYYASDTAVNPKIKSNAAIFKYDQDNKPLAGAVFSFYKDGSSTALETGLTTNASGLAKTAKTYNPGKYYFVETKAPTGYQIDSTKKYVTIEMTNTSETYYAEALVNPVNESKIAVHKIDYYYGYSLENAEFGIYEDSECKTAARDFITTDATGYGVSSESFKPGTYYLKETIPPAGHSLSTEIHTVTIPKTTSTTNVVVKEIPNTPLPQQIQVKKVDENTGVALQGAQFQVRKPAENMLDRIWLTDEFSDANTGNGWRTASWGANGTTKTITYTSEVSDTVGVDGSGAIKIDVTQVKGDARGRVYLNLKPSIFSDVPEIGQKYTFSCRVRTENIVPATGVKEFGAQITPTFVNPSGAPSDPSVSESDAIDYNTDLSINNGFVYLSVDFTIPEYVIINGEQTDFSYLRLTLALRGATGTAYFDDIKLTSNEYCAWQGSSIANATQSYYYVDSDKTPNSYQMNVSSTNITGISGRMMQNIDINEFESDRNYTFSCYIKVDSLQRYVGGADYGIRLSAFFMKSGAGYPVGGTFYSKTISNITSESINNGYIYLSVDFIAPNATDLATCSALNVRVEMINATGDVYVTQPRLYLNNKYDNFDDYSSYYWGTTSGTVSYTTSVNTETYAFGGKSIEIDVTDSVAAKGARVYYDVYDLNPGETYTFSSYVKTENLVAEAGQTNYGAVICATWYNSSGTQIGSKYSSYLKTATTSENQNSGFKRLSATFTIPSNFYRLRINLILYSTTGTAYFDEVRIEPEDTILATLTTNSNGIATYSPSLYSGEYEFMEILAPNGYYFSNATSVVNVNPDTYNGPTIMSTITNEPIKRSFSFVKKDSRSYNSFVQVGGATYEVYTSSTFLYWSRIATIVTDSENPVPILNESTGEPYEFELGTTYYIKETIAPKGYILDTNAYELVITADSWSITDIVSKDEIFSGTGNIIQVTDESYDGSVVFDKRYLGDNYDASQRATFVIKTKKTGDLLYFDDDNYWQAYESQIGTKTLFTMTQNYPLELYGLPSGEYYLEELSTGSNYIPHGALIEFSIKDSELNTVADVVRINGNYYYEHIETSIEGDSYDDRENAENEFISLVAKKYGVTTSKVETYRVNSDFYYSDIPENMRYLINACGVYHNAVFITANNYEKVLPITGGHGIHYINPLGLIVLAVIPVSYLSYKIVKRKKYSKN